MVILSGKEPRRAMTKILNRFQCAEPPPAGALANAASVRPTGIPPWPAPTGTVKLLEHEGDDTGGFLHDVEECLIPDARADMSPSDMVTRRASEMLYPTSPVVDPRPVLWDDARGGAPPQRGARPTEGNPGR